MSDLTPVLQEMAARSDATEMPLPHQIRRAGQRRRMRVAVATATSVVALAAVAGGALIREITTDAASVEPSGRLSANPSATISIQDLAGPGRPGALPPGTYRYTLTLQELRAHGLDDPEEAGVWTWTLGNGRWSYRFEHSPGFSGPTETAGPHAGWLAQQTAMFVGTHCAGYYDVVGHRVEFTTVTRYAHGECAPPTWFGTWSRAGNGLRMPNDIWLDEGAYVLGGRRWVSIPGTP